jgi:mono/diheme cytochrome c family protein
LTAGLLCVLCLALCACGHHVRRIADESASTAPTDANASAGAGLFSQKCAVCHGDAGKGGPIGPPLREEGKRKSRATISDAIENPTPPMPKLFPVALSAQNVDDLTAYVESL